MPANGHGASFWSDEIMSDMMVVTVVQLGEGTKNHPCRTPQRVNFMMCASHFNKERFTHVNPWVRPFIFTTV